MMMEHLKTYEKFQIGNHAFILVSKDKTHYVANAAISKINITLHPIELLDMNELDKLKRLKLRFDTLEESEEYLAQLECNKVYYPKRGDGEGPRVIWASRMQKRWNSNKDDSWVFDDELIETELNNLVPMRIFVRAYEDGGYEI